MKQTFTLFAALACSVLSAFGQITSENFENLSSTTPLINNCWILSNVNFQPAVVDATIGNSKNLIFPTGNGRLTTPYVNLTSSSTISFNYKLTTKLSGTQTRTMTVSLLSYDGVLTALGSPIVLDKTTGVSTLSFNATPTTSSIQKIVIDVSSGSNSSDFILIDNISFGGTLNFNGQYSCAAAATLPIKLKSFQGLVVAEKAHLNWAVADNEAGSHFEVERSANGKDFQTIAIVNTTDATGDENYTYKDGAQAAAYYRLKIVNNTKSVAYSNILLIKNTGVANTTNAITLLQNPVQATLKFGFLSESAASTQITVYNMTGVKVFQTSFKALKGYNTIATTLDGSIKSGTYVLEVTNPTNRSVDKFVKY